MKRPAEHKLGPRVDLPPLDYLGPWAKRAGRYAAHQKRDRLDPMFADDDAALPYYFRQARKAWAVADEERTRRLALEAELAISNEAFFERTPPVELFVERKVYTPMPPKQVVRRVTIERSVPLTPSIIVTPPAPKRPPLMERMRRFFNGDPDDIHIGMGR